MATQVHSGHLNHSHFILIFLNVFLSMMIKACVQCMFNRAQYSVF